MAMTKKVVSFSGKNRGDAVSYRPGWHQPKWRHYACLWATATVKTTRWLLLTAGWRYRYVISDVQLRRFSEYGGQ